MNALTWFKSQWFLVHFRRSQKALLLASICKYAGWREQKIAATVHKRAVGYYSLDGRLCACYCCPVSAFCLWFCDDNIPDLATELLSYREYWDWLGSPFHLQNLGSSSTKQWSVEGIFFFLKNCAEHHLTVLPQIRVLVPERECMWNVLRF